MSKEKSCNDCVSRFICPLRGNVCMGYNDEKVFGSLLSLTFPSSRVDFILENIKKLQENH